MYFSSIVMSVALMAMRTEPVTDGFTAIDEPTMSRIEVSLLNRSGHVICLLGENWPNNLGRIDQASEYVFLKISGTLYSMNSYNSGYPGGPELRVNPGKKAVAEIPYSAFNLPSEVSQSDKILIMNPHPRNCSR